MRKSEMNFLMYFAHLCVKSYTWDIAWACWERWRWRRWWRPSSNLIGLQTETENLKNLINFFSLTIIDNPKLISNVIATFHYYILSIKPRILLNYTTFYPTDACIFIILDIYIRNVSINKFLLFLRTTINIY